MKRTLIIELPSQTPNGLYRAIVICAEFGCVHITEAGSFTPAAMVAIEHFPDAVLTDAASDQLAVELTTGENA